MGAPLSGLPPDCEVYPRVSANAILNSHLRSIRWSMSTKNLDPSQYGSADRREVDPPIQVEMATWSPGGQLDWWVKEHRPRLEWWGRVRGADGPRQRTEATRRTDLERGTNAAYVAGCVCKDCREHQWPMAKNHG